MFYDRRESRQQRAQAARKLKNELPSIEAGSSSERWAAYREDNSGVDHLIAVNLPDEASARAKIDEITGQHHKPHGQEYYVAHYPEGGLKAFKASLNLAVKE